MINLLKTNFSKEIRSIRNLVKIAFSNGKISQEELTLLNSELDYLHVSPNKELDEKRLRLNADITSDRFFQYQVIYDLTSQMMGQSGLSQKKEKILKALMSVFEKSTQRINELVSFVQYNIRSGYSLEDSFDRLGYQMYLNRRACS
ncbi:MAG: hypothetical protein R8G66_33300 [Cytophagales bacterium]|nr:hypothetical protein [Cytophagales bacterium]